MIRIRPDCFPCFLRQTIRALELNPGENTDDFAVIKDILLLIREADTSKTPAYVTTFIHRAVREHCGTDPFRKVKHQFNDIALGLYPSLKKQVDESKDPLWTAARLAIAGNIIDFGIFSSVDIAGSINKALSAPLAVDDYNSFRKAVERTEGILYLHDNSGEIVFDRLLIEVLVSIGKSVKAVVKGSPVLNDATHEDAQMTGITELCDVMDNGSDAVGTIMEWTSSAFQQEFKNSAVVISKGQANFETLDRTHQETYFFFQSKCDVVSRELGLPTGSMLLKKS